MIKPSKAVIAGAAIAGLMTGSLAVRSYAASTQGKAGIPAQTLDDAQKGKHSCKGKNECKGQGGCKTTEGGPGQNSCKGQGGCATDGSPMPKAA
ncbi:MAG: hypothetical protein WB586_16750 [Chthoniobacterales bacterium]